MNIIVKPYGNNLCHSRPDTTWERENKDFYSPECVNEIYWTPVIFARISKAGKCIGRKFVQRYYDGVGCGMLMYCNRFTERDDSNEQHVNSCHQAEPTEARQTLASCVDRSSILPMPLYDPLVLENQENVYRVDIGVGNGRAVPSSHDVILSGAKNLLEETICGASVLTSLRIGDFVAVELEDTKILTAREYGGMALKGTFCGNEIFDFNIIF